MAEPRSFQGIQPCRRFHLKQHRRPVEQSCGLRMNGPVGSKGANTDEQNETHGDRIVPKAVP